MWCQKYNIEISANASKCNQANELFYKKVYNSFEQAVIYLIANGILAEFKPRIIEIHNVISPKKWYNESEFNAVIERFEY
jgi:hypothetical protein